MSHPEASSVFVLRRSKGCKTPEARLTRVAARVRGACIHTRCASLQTKIPCWDAGCCCWPFISIWEAGGVVGCQRCGSIDGNSLPWATNGKLLFRDVGGSGLGLRRAKKETIAGRLPQHLSEALGGSASSSIAPSIESLLQSNRAASAVGWAATVSPCNRGAWTPFAKAATWLILPVVICLSQRLSHACLSINCFIL